MREVFFFCCKLQQLQRSLGGIAVVTANYTVCDGRQTNTVLQLSSAACKKRNAAALCNNMCRHTGKTLLLTFETAQAYTLHLQAWAVL